MSGAPGLPFAGLHLFPTEMTSRINLDIYFYTEYTLENVPDLEANEAWLAEYLNDAEMQLNRKVAGQDLRHKLQKKGLQPATRSGKSTAPNIRDLRERLSGTMNQ
ncbi:hypothetical protein A2U01_0000863 [Trifolium medium]|uniref:Uncharacterized protein n=1 Tax=Trifolium medium TaxID=97028 RepID=A0A392LYP5_9FABA|nr:hypothetical protein [Trifolium medium]